MPRRCTAWLWSALACASPAFAQAPTTAPSADSAVPFTAEEIRLILRHSPLPDPPPDETNRVFADPAAAQLGRALFFDGGYSKNGKLSCASCHDPAQGLSDGKAVAEGLGRLTRHTPALWNVAHNRWYFWDGRADTLWSQAAHPIESPLELGSNRMRFVRHLCETPSLREAYQRVFGPLPDFSDAARFPRDARPAPENPDAAEQRAWDAMHDDDRQAVTQVFVNGLKAIAAFERTLVSRDSPFDRFAAGLRSGGASVGDAAFSPAAQRGLRLFLGRGNCRVCHAGPNFTDNEFHNALFPHRSGSRTPDPGRYEGLPALLADPHNAAGPHSDDREGQRARLLRFLVNRPENWGRVKTPSLRNVAVTAPYGHAGQYERLADVLEHYSTLADAPVSGHTHQETILQPLDLSPEEKRDLEAFLESLTDISQTPRRPP